ncbi:phosphopantetheine-binding protein [Peptoniphilaceae bacterium SGI.131]
MIKEQVLDIIREELGVDEFDLDADLIKEYEVDSISLLDFIMTLEEEFNIEIEDEEINELKTANDIIALVEKKVG